MNERLLRLMVDTLGVSEISAETAMANTPAWDSVMHLNICMGVEAEFGVSLTPEEMIQMTSVAAIENVLQKHSTA